MLFSSRSRSKSRARRRLSSPWINDPRDCPLERRSLAAPYFYRTAAFDLVSQVADLSANGNPIQDYETNPAQANASATQMGVDGNGNSWTDSSQAMNYVDDGGPTADGTGVISVSVSHQDQGQWAANPGPPNAQPIQAVYDSLALSGESPTGTIVPLTWTLAEPSPNGGPGTGSLPSGEIIQTDFSSNYTLGNPANQAGINLILVSSTMNVDINTSGGPGIVITDPNSAAPGITLPPNYTTPPAGEVIYFDPNFGAAGTDGASETLNTPISSAGPFAVGLAYISQMRSRQVFAPPPPGQQGPDLTNYQDNFTWTISFHPVVQDS